MTALPTATLSRAQQAFTHAAPAWLPTLNKPCELCASSMKCCPGTPPRPAPPRYAQPPPPPASAAPSTTSPPPSPQESPNDIPEGETPQGVTLYCFDNLVDVCRPGDRVTITGLYRAVPMRANPRQTALQSLFRTYIDVIHVQREESRRVFSQAAKNGEVRAWAAPGRGRAQGWAGAAPAPARDCVCVAVGSEGHGGLRLQVVVSCVPDTAARRGCVWPHCTHGTNGCRPPPASSAALHPGLLASAPTG